jgi:diguanylate cyclase (GGDEF)-like protein
MQAAPRLHIIETLNQTESAVIYRAKMEDVAGTVIVKQLIVDHPSTTDQARFRQEYERIKGLDIDGVIKVIDIVTDHGAISLVLEDFNGISLSAHLNGERVSVREFLPIAMTLSSVLGYLHQKNVIHKDIKPQNVLINPRTQQIKLTDFGISASITHDHKPSANKAIEGTLPYMSPEQTGRINRSVDYRTDMYSLGILFYEMLTGMLPFQSRDPMELIHAHIAKVAIPPSSLNAEVPEVISDIVMKLMSKNPEERYQNGFGLLADLEQCVRQLDKYGHIELFELATKEISPKFHIPQNILGREVEMLYFLDTFERLFESPTGRLGSAGEMILVSGQPGVGKSMLVSQIQLPVVARHGFFISGKYDQFRRDVPYSAMIQAFLGLVRQLIAEGEESLLAWRERLRHALGKNGKVISDLIPSIELIIGKQPEVPVLGLEESQNRFHFVFKNFLRSFSSSEHPLVLFLDDLQWADLASLNLIRTLVTDEDIRYFLFIGAYRDNEVDPRHPFSHSIDAIAKDGVEMNRIEVLPLDIEIVTQMVAKLLRCEPEQAIALADIVHAKTLGNPFFVNVFLKNLYDEQVIELDPVTGWSWDLDKLARLSVTDNVVQMMAAKISDLPAATRELLQVCACIGNRFDLDVLTSCSGKTIEDTLSAVSDAMEEGFISLYEDTYRFYHDRIQAAAYSLLSDEEKARIHYAIGSYGLKVTPPEQLQHQILYIVDQLNAGQRHITSTQERRQLAQLNHLAGKKTQQSAAYDAALKYYLMALEILGPRHWDSDYQLTLTLYSEAARAAQIAGDLAQSEQLCAQVTLHAKTLLDRLPVEKIRIDMLSSKDQMYDALMAALKLIDQLGVRLPQKPGKTYVIARVLEAKWKLSGNGARHMLGRSNSSDPSIQALMNIVATAGVLSAWTVHELLPVLFTLIIKKSIEHGNSTETPFALAAMGVIESGLGNIDRAYELSMLALELMEKMNVRAEEPRILIAINAYVIHFKFHTRICMQKMNELAQKSRDVGNNEFQSAAIFLHGMLHFFSGDPLDVIEQGLLKDIQLVERLHRQTDLNMIRLVRQVAVNLSRADSPTFTLSGDIYDEAQMLPLHLKANDSVALYCCYTFKAILSYHSGDYAQSISDLRPAHARAKNMVEVGYMFLISNFYDSLAHAASVRQAVPVSPISRPAVIRRISHNQKKMRKWAHHAPMNCLHMCNLIEAELARLKGNTVNAMRFYDQAISAAKKNGFTNDLAITLELTALFYLEQEQEMIARMYMTAAAETYQKWGVPAKTAKLKNLYPHLILASKPNGSSSHNTITASVGTDALDLSTVIKSSQTLSGEIDLALLLQTIMKHLIENAGAEKGTLIFEDEAGRLLIEAEFSLGQEGKIMSSIPVEDSDKVCAPIVRYVAKTKEDVVLNNAAADTSMFVNDSYIAQHEVKSLLCSPIMHKGKVSAIIYLENNLTSHAFTAERLQFLKIMSSQAAISIQNAQLYKLATTDRMTTLYNNTHFQNLLEKMVVEVADTKAPLTLLMFDVDHFKKFNDSYGHQAGDEVLKVVARTVRSSFRKTDICARYGGEEFAVILPDTSITTAKRIAENLRENIANLSIIYHQQTLSVKISVGVAGIPVEQVQPISKDQLIKAADTALYQSKARGRNCVSVAEMIDVD